MVPMVPWLRGGEINLRPVESQVITPCFHTFHVGCISGAERDFLGEPQFGSIAWENGAKIIYPLVNVNKKLWKITIFHGKTHYFYGHWVSIQWS